MPGPRFPPLRRFFQLQIPQRFRPTVTSVLAKTLGRVNLEAPAVGLSALVYWARFSRWCSKHPVPSFADSKNGNGLQWLYESVVRQECLDKESLTYLEFGVYQGDSLRSWLNIDSPSTVAIRGI